jgi:hypothetical protein
MEAALAEIREPFNADGADVVLDGFEGGVARFRLVFGPDTCQECILPKPHIERVIRAILTDFKVDFQDVSLVDPRST